jgi:DNA-binding IclR family transcriptional regulator
MGNMTLDALKALYPERQLESVAPQTPTTVQELYKRVVATLELGYGVSEGFFEHGISVISAPVRDMSGKIVAAVSITIPRSEIGSIAEREALITSVRDAALALSERLNYTRP